MPRDQIDLAQGTWHCCFCGRRFKTEGELRNHYRLWGKIHKETSVFKPCEVRVDERKEMSK